MSPATAGALEVAETVPAPHALAVPTGLQTVTVRFDADLGPLPSRPIRVAATMSGLHDGTVEAQGDLLTFTNTSEPFFPGELVTVNLHRDLVDTGGEPLFGGASFAFTIASAPAAADWRKAASYGTAPIPYFIHGGDLDEDGRPDVAAPNEGTHDVSVFLNAGSGQFPTHQEYGVGQTPSSIFGEDFDDDGDQDLATADINGGTVTVLLNNGDGTFADGVAYPAADQCRQIHGGDFDGDLDVDLCATSFATDRVYVYRNNGDGTFSADPPITGVPDGPFAIRTGDFDGDRHLDIAVACQNADSVTVLRNNGIGGFSRSGTWVVGNGPWCLNGNDYDGDGDFDLVSVASFANRLVVLFNDGAGGFGERHLAPTGSFPLGVFAADLDGDGDIDATSSNYSGGSVGVYLNPGDGRVALQASLPVTSAASYTWAHDLDGDGDLDLSVVDENADSLFVYENAGSPTASPDGGPDDDARFARGPSAEVRPNPIEPGRGTQILLRGVRGEATIDLVGVDGRRLRRIWSGQVTGEALAVDWDGLGAGDVRLSRGRYFVEVRTGAQTVARPVVILAGP